MMTLNTTLDARDLAIQLTEVDAISERDLLIACLKYMSTDEVADMLEANELLTRKVYHFRA